MLLLLLALLLYACDCKNVLDIKDAGIGHINEGDVGLIFYLTLVNEGDQNLEISLKMLKCCEMPHKRSSHPVTINRKSHCNMLIIGGTMGTLKKGRTRNVTLVYPNMYLMDREGSCSVEVKYEDKNNVQKTSANIKFSTYTHKKNCPPCPGGSTDKDLDSNCDPVDCVAKYAGYKNFFNSSCRKCVSTPTCRSDPTSIYPQKGYSITRNRCVNLRDRITKYQALGLIIGKWSKNRTEVPIHNFVCHHGNVDILGRCNCKVDWSTVLDDDVEYYPTLMQYHMCNIETSSWNHANKGKMKTTALIMAILAVAIASKVLIFMCIVGWCYKQLRTSLLGDDDDDDVVHVCTSNGSLDDASIVLSDSMDLEECLCEEMSGYRSPILQNETFNDAFIPSAGGSSYSTGSYSFGSGSSQSQGLSEKKEFHVSYVSSAHLSCTSSSLPISFETGSDDESSTDDSDFTDETDDDSDDDDDDSDLELSESDEDDFCHCEEDPVDGENPQEDKGGSDSVKSKRSQDSRHSETSRHSEKKEE